MTKYELNFEIEDEGTVAFSVTANTFKLISKFCQESFPEYDWQISKQ